MPIVMQPVDADPGLVTCGDLLVKTPEDATFYACPVKMKTRTAIIRRGELPKIRWEMRDAAGQSLDITDCLQLGELEEGEVKVRFGDPFDCTGTYTELLAVPFSPESGLVDVQLTPALVAEPGIWTMEFAVFNASGNLIKTDQGLLSVERGLFGSGLPGADGPLTIGEIRLALRDTWVENDLRGEVEYSDAEILTAIINPIRYWNERPPPIGFHTPKNFPYRYAWLQAVKSELLRTAAVWYLRNHSQTSSAGVTDNSRDKQQAYMQLAQKYEDEWKTFVRAKKIQLNIQAGWGGI